MLLSIRENSFDIMKKFPPLVIIQDYLVAIITLYLFFKGLCTIYIIYIFCLQQYVICCWALPESIVGIFNLLPYIWILPNLWIHFLFILSNNQQRSLVLDLLFQRGGTSLQFTVGSHHFTLLASEERCNFCQSFLKHWIPTRRILNHVAENPTKISVISLGNFKYGYIPSMNPHTWRT